MGVVGGLVCEVAPEFAGEVLPGLVDGFVPGLFEGVAGKFEGWLPCCAAGDWLGAPAVVPAVVLAADGSFCALGVAVDVGHGTIGVFGFGG